MGEKTPKGTKTVRNSSTLVGATIGSFGGPLWALLVSGLSNALTGFPETEWNTINTSVGILLMLTNAVGLVMALAVASRCASAGSSRVSEFTGALLISVPYVLYRAVSPCRDSETNELLRAMAPVVLYKTGGYLGRAERQGSY